MAELREIARQAWADGRNQGYLRWCDDCEGAHLLDRYALTGILMEEFKGYSNLEEKWNAIGFEFSKIEALLHASGLVNVHAKVVEPPEGRPEKRESYQLICQDCYDERVADGTIEISKDNPSL